MKKIITKQESYVQIIFMITLFSCGKLKFLLPDKVVSPGLVVLRPYRPRPRVLPIVLHPWGGGERAGITEEGEAAAEALSGAQEGDLRGRDHKLKQGDFEQAKGPDLTFPAHGTYLITDFPMFFWLNSQLF